MGLVQVCYRCKGTGQILIWVLNRPEIIGCTYCSGTGEQQSD